MACPACPRDSLRVSSLTTPLLRSLPAVMGQSPATKRERPMRHRTLTLLATPAVLGAMTVAVPALAGVDNGPAAHSSSSKCFVARIAKHRVRECLVQGPRGLRGLPGPAGHADTPGRQAKRGPPGKQALRAKQEPQDRAQDQRGPRDRRHRASISPSYNPTSPSQANADRRADREHHRRQRAKHGRLLPGAGRPDQCRR